MLQVLIVALLIATGIGQQEEMNFATKRDSCNKFNEQLARHSSFFDFSVAIHANIRDNFLQEMVRTKKLTSDAINLGVDACSFPAQCDGLCMENFITEMKTMHSGEIRIMQSGCGVLNSRFLDYNCSSSGVLCLSPLYLELEAAQEDIGRTLMSMLIEGTVSPDTMSLMIAACSKEEPKLAQNLQKNLENTSLNIKCTDQHTSYYCKYYEQYLDRTRGKVRTPYILGNKLESHYQQVALLN